MNKLIKLCMILLCMVFVGSLFGCESNEPEQPVIVEDYIPDSQDLFEYYELQPYLSDPDHCVDEFDTVNTISHRIAHLPTSSTHVSVEACDYGRAIVTVEVTLRNGYHHSSDVLSMIVDQLEIVLANSDFEVFEYSVEVDFDEGCQYFEVYDGLTMTDSGSQHVSTLTK